MMLIGVLSVCAASTASRLGLSPLQAPLEAGDLIRFERMTPPGRAPSTKLLVHRAGAFGCVLDPDVLRRSGGSLMLEGRLDEAPDAWRLRWAGGRTSLDTADCGDAAELIMSSADIRQLAAAATAEPTSQGGR